MLTALDCLMLILNSFKRSEEKVLLCILIKLELKPKREARPGPELDKCASANSLEQSKCCCCTQPAVAAQFPNKLS